MKKRMLTMLLALVMIMSMLPFSAMADGEDCIHGFTYIETEEASCFREGAINCKCRVCGILLWSLPMGGGLAPHDFGPDDKCTVCGFACKKHTYGPRVTIPATCTEIGYTIRTCTVCGHEDITNRKDASGHKFTVSVVGRVATCTQEGYTGHKVCAKCGVPNEEFTLLPITVHDFVRIDGKEVSCTEKGSYQLACKNCDFVNREIIEPTGHNYVSIPGKNPTCTEAGYGAYQQCTKCGDVQGYTTVRPTGHDFGNIYGQCICGAVDPNQSGPSVSNPACRHTYTDTEKKAPTCTEDGYVKKICEDCGMQTSFELLEHFGHNCVNGVCTRCGGADPNKYTNDFQDYFVVGGPGYIG